VNAVEKQKDKKREDKLPDRLLFAAPFEFTSSLPVEECAYRLHEMNLSKTGLLLPRIATYVFSDVSYEYRFYIRQMERTPFKWTMGSLAASDEASTSISGQIGAAKDELFISVCTYLAGLLLFAAFELSHPIRILVPWILWTGIFSFGMFINLRYARFNILKILKSNLEAVS
jgi:hypothetical protein